MRTIEELEDEIEHLREQIRARRSFMRDHAIAHHGAAPWTDEERAGGLVPVGEHRHGLMCRTPATDPAPGLVVTREAVQAAWDQHATRWARGEYMLGLGSRGALLAALGVTVAAEGEA